MRFERFDILDKILFIIDNGLIKDLNYNLPKSKKSFFELFIIKIISKFNVIFFYPIKLLFKRDKLIAENRNWLIFESLNNYNTLKTLSNTKNVFIKPNDTIVYRYLFFYKVIYFFPLLIWLYNQNKLRWFFIYYDILGVYEESQRIIKKYVPKKIIFANDINPYQVALKLAAKKINIPTYYFQHACISKYMPPLDFDVAFLEGQDSLQKYKEIGEINSEIELIGMIKYQNSKYKLNKNKEVKKIGIAFNTLDKIDDILNTIKVLSDRFPNVNFYIRQHPRDKRELGFLGQKINYSDSKHENVFDFIEKIDLLIAGDSSIHLEAALLNVVPVYFKFSRSDLFDVYGFVKNKLVFYARNIETLCLYITGQIQSKDEVIQRTKYYNEYIRTGVDYISIFHKHGLL